MNSVMHTQVDAPAPGASAAQPRARNAILAAVHAVWSAWSSITRRELQITLGCGLTIAIVSMLVSLDLFAAAWDQDQLLIPLTLLALCPALLCPIGLLSWVIADRASDAGMKRPWRLATALVVTALLYAALMPVVAHEWLGLPDPCAIEQCTHAGKPIPPVHLRYLGSVGYVLVFGGLLLTLVELQRRRRLAGEALAAAQQERSRLQRLTFESQLAAMQAQVEPQFLFDSLVDVQALYERDATVGASTLDRLIAYLRTALPRLRESGSNVSAEVELVDAYLSVVSARHGRPAVELRVPPDCATARFYPMLLLPLVQRAVRRARALPALIALAIDHHGAQMRARLTVHAADGSAADAAALFAHDDELARVRARLAGLYAERAQLDCTHAGDRTTFILTWPHERPGDA